MSSQVFTILVMTHGHSSKTRHPPHTHTITQRPTLLFVNNIALFLFSFCFMQSPGGEHCNLFCKHHGLMRIITEFRCVGFAARQLNPFSAAVRLVYMQSVCYGHKLWGQVMKGTLYSWCSKYIVCVFVSIAGRNTTNEELESMLESDNPAIFTSGVSGNTDCS